MKILKTFLLTLFALTVFAQEENEQVESFTFEAEVSRLLDIIINSLYSNKDIFLREAISNSNDALEKLRFLSLEDPDLMKDDAELRINLEVDKDAGNLVLTDTGIGMTLQDLKNNLGTIARSGTTQFLEAITQTGNMNLIGQFGVGFYSYFLVANKVRVITKHPSEDAQYIWESEAGSTYTIKKDNSGPFLKRGTRIELELKKDAKEFLNMNKIQDLTKKYSQFIEHPIYLYKSKQVTKEVPIEKDEVPKEETEETKEESTEEEKKQDDLDIKEEGEEEKPKTKKVTETVFEWERLNEQKAIWKRSPEAIEESEYKEFYKNVTKEYSDPLSWVHFKAEGEIDFTALLFIPKKTPTNLFKSMAGESDDKPALKLYVRKVLISDQFDELLPKYLAFVKGVVDSDDLPLNVSRETLQQYRSVKVIKKKITKKILAKLIKFSKGKVSDPKALTGLEGEELEKAKKEQEEAAKNARKEYFDFYAEFAKFLKHGIIEDVKNRDKIAKLLRYNTTEGADLTSLEEYISRMPEEQKDIYFIGGDNLQEMKSKPVVKALKKRGYEVLLMDEPIDEYCVQHMSSFDGKNLVNITKSDFKPPKDENEEKTLERLVKFYTPLTDWLKKTLSQFVEKVELTLDTGGQPMVVLAGASGYTANMQKIALNQPMANRKQTEEMLKRMKNVAKVNPYHPIVKELLDRIRTRQDGSEPVEPELQQTAHMLYQVAALHAGFRLIKPESFVSNFNGLVKDNLGLSRSSGDVDLEEELADYEKLEEARKAAEEERKKREAAEEAALKAAEEAKKQMEAETEAEAEVQVEDVEPQVEDIPAADL